MKISNILIALALLCFVACNGKKSKSEQEHGHSHDTEEGHGHPHHEDSTHHDDHAQEEFTISADSASVNAQDSTHTHEDGSTHQNHN